MLELGDAEREILRLLASHEPEALKSLLRRVRRKRAEPLGLCPPARDRVTHRAPHLVALDADPAREVIGDVIGCLYGERGPTECGKQKLLD
jgi:hypothetical protein